MAKRLHISYRKYKWTSFRLVAKQLKMNFSSNFIKVGWTWAPNSICQSDAISEGKRLVFHKHRSLLCAQFWRSQFVYGQIEKLVSAVMFIAVAVAVVTIPSPVYKSIVMVQGNNNNFDVLKSKCQIMEICCIRDNTARAERNFSVRFWRFPYENALYWLINPLRVHTFVPDVHIICILYSICRRDASNNVVKCEWKGPYSIQTIILILGQQNHAISHNLHRIYGSPGMMCRVSNKQYLCAVGCSVCPVRGCQNLQTATSAFQKRQANCIVFVHWTLNRFSHIWAIIIK